MESNHPLVNRRANLEATAKEQIEKATENLQQQVEKKAKELEKIQHEEAVKEAKEEIASEKQKSSKLIYFSHPIAGYSSPPSWVEPIRNVLIEHGYLVFAPWWNASELFTEKDLPLLQNLQPKLVPATCDLLKIPREVLLPVEHEVVNQLITRGDSGEYDCIVFKDLWFLSRASLVLCDLTQPMFGMGTAQELLYAKQLDIPSIGLVGGNGKMSPWIPRSVSVLHTSLPSIASILPLVQGYAPLYPN